MLALSLLIVTSFSTAEASLFANVTGDIILGGLFPIHRKGSGSKPCGKIQMEDGIQPLEAMLYAVGQINGNPDILPGVRLGVLAYDSCDNPSYALEQTLNFVKGFIAHVNEHHKPEFQCTDGSLPKYRGGDFDRVVAVLAEQSSSVTIQVAALLRMFAMPQISYMSTTPSLSSRDRYPHFFRTVPNDVNQAHAMLEILREYRWTYVSLIYSNTEYGVNGYETLLSLASSYKVCFTSPQRVDKDAFGPQDYDKVINFIRKKTNVRVVVLFAEKVSSLRVMDAARRLKLGSYFVWIGSDAWSTNNRRDFLNPQPSRRKDPDKQVVLEGALAVQPLSHNVFGFDEYIGSLGLEHEAVDPWFREFWHEYHKCDDTNPTVVDEDYDESAPRVSQETGFKQNKFAHFVRDAVYAVANALHNLYVDRCGRGHRGMCQAMRHIDGSTLIGYLANVTFKDEANNMFRFINGTDGPPRYTILNYQRSTNGSYHWHVVGNYTQKEDGTSKLVLNKEKLKYRGTEVNGFPSSRCQEPCKPTQIMIREKLDTCCGHCRNCGIYQYKVGEHTCEDCPRGFRPTKDKLKCSPIPEEFVDLTSPWALSAVAAAVVGILLTSFALSVFWLYQTTPIIKAAGRELSYVLLFGTFSSFLMTFAIIRQPDSETCAITRFGIGLCCTLCYAALVTKTNRIYRIFNNVTNSPRKPRFTSPESQLLITFLITSPELAINAIWLKKAPAEVVNSYPTRDRNYKICKGFDDSSYMIGFIYPIFLTFLCSLYAVKTRKCPEGFNEARYIAFTNYTTMLLWMAFVPLYLSSTSNAIRAVMLALSLSLGAFVQLACLFFPKIYIVLRKPEKNTKQLVMSTHRNSSYLPTSTTPIVATVEKSKIEC
ncbi:metabotropic glutamate receptor 6-like [Copidosoma floridanum]|uniref:metabotropic glutamate receptor 6-like n=1 Tax=Copidosoma floridanum TaxID=29053 RepID=UPI0006C9CE20|nr:metabotropic glutamate receptor 6-like [Copidosoma floridanum]